MQLPFALSWKALLSPALGVLGGTVALYSWSFYLVSKTAYPVWFWGPFHGYFLGQNLDLLQPPAVLGLMAAMLLLSLATFMGKAALRDIPIHSQRGIVLAWSGIVLSLAGILYFFLLPAIGMFIS